jgi:peptidoglycan/xylan/chitin deacetylase (PgdA/CDA1 family)
MISRLSKLAIAMLFFVGNKICRMLCRLTGKYLPPTLVVITYHPVKSSQIKRFEKQMNTLLNIGYPVSLDNNLDSLKKDYNIAVTFDDAYQSVLKNAVPVLRKKQIPATIFVPTGNLGKKPTWITDPAHIYADETVLTESQVKELPADFITIGSHTVSHIHLANVDESIARREIFESKETLELILNKKATLFAAPYATLNEKFIPLFREAGFKRVFLNIPTFPATKTNLFVLGRISVEPTDWPIEYRLKLSGAYQWLPLAVFLKKKILWRDNN